MIEGKTGSYFFPITILKEARFENASDELKTKLNLLIENKDVK